MAPRSAGVHQGIALELGYDAILGRVLRALVGAEIPVMPLKGVLFARWLYEHPAERLGGDIDLLVPPSCYARAVELLSCEFGEGVHSPTGQECTFLGSKLQIQIDLHRALFGSGRFRLRTEDLFARGKEDRALFGEPVILPDPYDVYAHLIGHDAASHVPELPVRRQHDFTRLVDRFGLEPGACAQHLDTHGLGRAARYIYGVPGGADLFGRRVEAALRPDALGKQLVRIATAITTRFSQSSMIARMAGLLTNTSLPLSAVVVSVYLAIRIRRWLGLLPD